MRVAEISHGSSDSDYGLGTLLRMPYQAMMTDVVEPALSSAGCSDIRSAHLPVFQALASHPDGLRATELAEYARITKQSMGSLIDHLGKGGYIERVPDPIDLRAKVVRLTQRGWTASRAIRAAVQGVEADWARRIGSERVGQLRTILQDLVASYGW